MNRMHLPGRAIVFCPFLTTNAKHYLPMMTNGVFRRVFETQNKSIPDFGIGFLRYVKKAMYSMMIGI